MDEGTPIRLPSSKIASLDGLRKVDMQLFYAVRDSISLRERDLSGSIDKPAYHDSFAPYT
jgi:hypothetical protein